MQRACKWITFLSDLLISLGHFYQLWPAYQKYQQTITGRLEALDHLQNAFLWALVLVLKDYILLSKVVAGVFVLV
jgi:hypothetical protein